MTQELAFPDAKTEVPIETMSREEADRLRELENQIDRATDKFGKAVFGAFVEIHDRKLYRARQKSFADYCLNRWGWTSRSSAYSALAKAREALAIEARAKANKTTPAAQAVTEAAAKQAASPRAAAPKVRGESGKGAGQRVGPPRISAAATTQAPGIAKRPDPSAADRLLGRALGLLDSVGTGKKWGEETTRPELLNSARKIIDFVEAAEKALAKRGIQT